MVVATLCLLFTLLGLNLAGLFEFGLFIPDRWASMQSRHPTVNALGSGVLAVAIASPCTAPFMGASLGLAIGLPAWQALPIFAAMGIGLALPYLAASWWPVLAEAMPRPGAWMQTLRQALAFPMFATVVWLLWVLGQQTGLDGAAALLGLLVMTAFLVWAWGLQGRARWIMSAVGLVMTWVIGQTLWPLLNAAPQNTTATIQEARWQVWSESEVQSALAAGRPVFVDFTAAWCVTCQFNKKTTLSDTEFLITVQERQAVLLRADWTRRDPAITQALTQLGRSGVPVYVVYVPGLPAQVLSELPSVQDITDALRQSKP
jgi:thiol:disulfide interchange protein DsbD